MKRESLKYFELKIITTVFQPEKLPKQFLDNVFFLTTSTIFFTTLITCCITCIFVCFLFFVYCNTPLKEKELFHHILRKIHTYFDFHYKVLPMFYQRFCFYIWKKRILRRQKKQNL